MKEDFFIGVDGGASKTIIRLENKQGDLIAKTIAGPTNLRFSVDNAWRIIDGAINSLLTVQAINHDSINLHVAMGLAGTESPALSQAFQSHKHSYKTLLVTSDAHIACLAAHHQDGAIISIGTGVIGYQIENGKATRVSGYGFPHDDQGGGAWLGFEAVRLTLQTLDCRVKPSLLTEKILAHFSGDKTAFVLFANSASSTDYAKFAPMVFELQDQDLRAKELLQHAARHIEEVVIALAKQRSLQIFPLALLGGMAGALIPYLDPVIQDVLINPKSTPEAGAIIMLRESLK